MSIVEAGSGYRMCMCEHCRYLTRDLGQEECLICGTPTKLVNECYYVVYEDCTGEWGMAMDAQALYAIQQVHGWPTSEGNMNPASVEMCLMLLKRRKRSVRKHTFW